MGKQAFFCQRLAEWLYQSEWHFTTLLAAMINTVDHLPDNADSVVNALLIAHPVKPDVPTISTFLSQDAAVTSWFQRTTQRPEVVSVNLNAPSDTPFEQAELPALYNEQDVADWLDISVSQLLWYSDLWRHDERQPAHFMHYHYALVPKRSGGKRLIESPKTQIKCIQRKLNKDIINHMPVHNSAHAYLKGRSYLSHASLHTQQRYLLRFDLAHFFQSVRWLQIYRAFMRLGYSAGVSKHLTGICSHRCPVDKSDLWEQLEPDLVKLLKNRHLPQGSPCSPALSNVVLFGLDSRLSGLSKSTGLIYSRYADDFVFSGSRHKDWQSFIALVGAICLEEGFALNYRKTRLITSSQKQTVTGVVVNEKVNVDRRYYDRLKATLTNCIRHGPSSQNVSEHPYFKQHLLGCIQHVKSLNDTKGKKLERLFADIRWP